MKLSPLAMVLLWSYGGATGLPAQNAPERYCQPAEWPRRMPPVDTVVDSAALAFGTATLHLSDTTALLFSILYLEDGSSTVRLLQPDALPPELRESFIETVSRTVRPRGKADRVSAVRLWVRGGSAGQLALERSVYCPPAFPPGAGVFGSTITATVRQEDRMPPAGRPRRVDMQLSLDDDGHVTDVRVINGTGLREFDEQLVNDAYRQTFLPAMIDGLPIKSWVRTNGTRMKL